MLELGNGFVLSFARLAHRLTTENP